MQEYGVLAAVDLGTTRFRAVVAEVDDHGKAAVLGHASLLARGLERGQLIDLPLAASAIAEVVSAAADEAEAEVSSVAVGVPGDTVRSLSARGVVTLDSSGGSVTRSHLRAANQKVTSMGIPFDRVILHCLPVEYTLDDRAGLQNPAGMVGARLELDAHVVTGTQSAVSAVDRAVLQAGYRADSLVFGPCATSQYLVEANERDHGCLLIDIGGEVTQYALFCRGRMRRSGMVPVGGNHVTRDIAYGLDVDPTQAELVKMKYGTALRSSLLAASSDPELGAEVRSQLAAICEARQQEILELVANGLQWGISRPSLASGIILTGGGSRLEGAAELAEQVFALRATTRRAPGDDFGSEPDTWATALGLIQFALDAETRSTTAVVDGPTVQGRLWSNVKRWIGRLV